MNKQLLNQLKHQASSWCDQNIPEQFDEEIMGYGVPWENKFAEMIVRECINQAHSVGDLRGANDDMIYGADTAAVKISKHFGVEQ